jgi:hypothetical protein
MLVTPYTDWIVSRIFNKARVYCTPRIQYIWRNQDKKCDA